MGQYKTQNSPFYGQALNDFLSQRKGGCFTSKAMNKWIRKRIMFYEGAKNTEQQDKPSQDRPLMKTWEETTEEERKPYFDKAVEILQDYLTCTRVWSAWSCGTMSQDDFGLVAEDDDIVSDTAKMLHDFAAEVVKTKNGQPDLPSNEGMEKEIIKWLLSGEVGESSKTIATVIIGLPVDTKFRTEPSDPADFKRCLKLVNLIPGIRERLPEMAKVSGRWANLIARWDELEACFMAEVPEWLDDKGHEKRAAKTYQLMKDIGL